LLGYELDERSLLERARSEKEFWRSEGYFDEPIDRKVSL